MPATSRGIRNCGTEMKLMARDRSDLKIGVGDSKRRKIVSPTSKSPGPEKELSDKVEGSTSAKGSLERFLQKPKHGGYSCDLLNSRYEQKAGQATVRRNLALQPVLPSSRGFEGSLAQSNEVSEAVPKGVDGCSAGFSEMGVVMDRSTELAEFATGFLSLYCGELQSSLNLPVQAKEISLQLEGDSSKKRHKCADPGKNSTPSIPIQDNIVSKCTDLDISRLKVIL
ncbi:hypothetical protein M569_11261 [Genlisea aurea]|uniref:Uncharacterized protein n=1 Tax=Genlisea aurea TaxID=192259 RepID=S8C9C4_9LAMI|nr:hypothetical protein M569_11261 [Genlisea aurea]